MIQNEQYSKAMVIRLLSLVQRKIQLKVLLFLMAKNRNHLLLISEETAINKLNDTIKKGVHDPGRWHE